MDLPRDLISRIDGRTLEPVSLGESGAGVWRCTAHDAATLYLKAAPVRYALRLDNEAERLRWMWRHELPVPSVVEHGRIEGIEYLLMHEVRGTPASDAGWTSRVAEVVGVLGTTLARIHRTPLFDCPFDQRVAGQVAEARRRVTAGLVREDDFDVMRAGRMAHELLDELIVSAPRVEDLVFTHGDLCLPNVILSTGPDGALVLAGLIDCGRAGLADRYQDIALAVRSVRYNFGAEWVAPFYAAYGLARPDEGKLEFYTLLDEFF